MFLFWKGGKILSISVDEQETTINFSRKHAGCEIWTSDTTVMTKLDKLCETSPEYYRLHAIGEIDGEIVDKCYIVSNKKMVSFRSGKVKLSESEKQARAERMRERHRAL